MNFDPTTLFYVTLFGCVLLGAEGLFMLFEDMRAKNRRTANRRQRLLARKANREAAMDTLRRRSILADSEGPMAALTRIGAVRWLDQTIGLAGLTLPTAHVLAVLCGGTGALYLFLAVARGMAPAQALAIAVLVGAALPILALHSLAKRRIRRFGEQLPDALDTIVRSLRAGHPVTTSLHMVAEQMSDPIGTEIGLVVDEMTYGLDLRDAVEKLGERIPHPDLRYLVVAIKIQYGSGGNLAEVLSGLSAVIRARFQMLKKVRALAAEGRLSAKVVSLLPVVVAGALSIMNPDYFGSVAQDPMFKPGIAAATVLWLTANVVIHHMVNFKV